MSDLEPENFDPHRRLCPDGDCVGIIGSDGRCSECGLADDGSKPGLGPEAFAGGCASDDDDLDGPDSGHHTGEHARRDGVLDVAYAAPDFDPERRLCPDGNCVGVIENGRCKLCGRDAAEG
jgi:hypothetical protein